MYNRDFGFLSHYGGALLGGLWVSIKLTFIVLILGTIMAIILAFLKLSKNNIFKRSGIVIGEILVGLPVLVLLVWLYYVLPILTGLNIPAYETAIIALTLNLGAFGSEIIRAGIQAVPKGEIEAGKVFGMTKLQIIRYIILPQVLRIILPSLSGRYVETIKLTSLASIISVNELLHVGQNIISITFRPLEVYTAIAVLYLLIILPLVRVLRHVEKKYNL